MPSSQQFLFAPESPLVERLGQRFFRNIPEQAGVYKMRDGQDNVVYVGKAKRSPATAPQLSGRQS